MEDPDILPEDPPQPHLSVHMDDNLGTLPEDPLQCQPSAHMGNPDALPEDPPQSQPLVPTSHSSWPAPVLRQHSEPPHVPHSSPALRPVLLRSEAPRGRFRPAKRPSIYSDYHLPWQTDPIHRMDTTMPDDKNSGNAEIEEVKQEDFEGGYPSETPQTVPSDSTQFDQEKPKDENVSANISAPQVMPTVDAGASGSAESRRPSSMGLAQGVIGEDVRESLRLRYGTSGFASMTPRGRSGQWRPSAETGSNSSKGFLGTQLFEASPNTSSQKPLPFVEESDDDSVQNGIRRVHDARQHHRHASQRRSEEENALKSRISKYAQSSNDTEEEQMPWTNFQSSEYQHDDQPSDVDGETMDETPDEPSGLDRYLDDDMRIPEPRMLTLQRQASYNRKRSASPHDRAQSYIRKPRPTLDLTTEDVVKGLIKGNIDRQRLLQAAKDSTNVHKALEDTERKLEGANARLHDYKQALKEKDSKSDVRRLEGDVREKNREIERRKKELQKMTDKLADEINKRDGKIEKLKVARQESLDESKKLEKDVKKLESEIKAQQKAFDRASKDIEGLQTVVSELQKVAGKKDTYLHLVA
ncbi:uncharacterized protein BDZ99DRAFT_476430 [Mytilinidion resinicola]|uniref:Uncharacterized protein n=1 Tax=Mytilinidion resinicola TaxID=574789 RepID=A0A6A6YQU0_9PEZI|nr:uncharacterized protein BDZ99DRAFT_476430 [Mytilinidion resinicola]KAF2810247.1 hypothetical protein BDZ99DRAFT_476430 [Mytilinidion resinicola]